jgi:phosphotransferase system enzyme I (PtsI)
VTEGRQLEGIAASPGVVVGPCTVVDAQRVPIIRRHVPPERVPEELLRLDRALAEAKAELEAIEAGLGPEVGADARLLLEAQLLMHGDALLVETARRTLSEERIVAEWALRKTVEDFAARLEDASEPYFRARAQDVRQVGEHVLRVLTGASSGLPTFETPRVLVARELSPADAVRLHASSLLALVTGEGSARSHTAILARALGVPAVVGVSEATARIDPGDVVIVDGLRGEVTIQPTEEEAARARHRGEAFAAFQARLKAVEPGQTRCKSGEPVVMAANVELELELAEVRERSAEAIGLYRTEFLYLGRDIAPSEHEQAAAYRRIVKRMAPRPVTFRTFDLGGDKLALGIDPGPNPALGLRGLRVAFEHPELLVTQLRALLRASNAGPVRVLFPMVATLSDLRRARVLLARAKEDLEAARVPYGPVPVGCMIEIPSAVLMAEHLAEHCDFFSVGSNDLAQYTTATDRTDPRVARLGRGLDPSVLKLLKQTREAAAATGRGLSLCGDLAASPVALPVLIGLGYRELSMTAQSLPLIREAIGRLEVPRCEELVDACLREASADDVERLVIEAFEDTLGDLWKGQGLEL